MNRLELSAILESHSVPKQTYSLYGRGRGIVGYHIIGEKDLYSVLYTERGDEIVLGEGLSEEAACDLIYDGFKQSYHWNE